MDDTFGSVAAPLPVGKVRGFEETNAAADLPPTAEFADHILAKVRIHLVAGHLQIAQRVIKAASLDWQNEVREQLAARRRRPADWLPRPLHELGLTTQSTNALEDAGAVTIADCLAIVADRSRWPENFGEFRADEVRCAARRLGLSITRNKPTT
jgi:DNA-directed RNA polymerase alpha subunit